ncbi:hypothetical protein Q8F55_008059 [Vanrija albida]|uniref:C3H1-type domain-containing protein n=1 Tax=Vanrija albida TaxID=181172 RepID=A0ABR3PV92_9TREE
MSVPAASPSPLPPKSIPRARPTPIAGAAGASPAYASPSGSSLRTGRSYARSVGFDTNGAAHSATDDSNWRARTAGEAGSVPRSLGPADAAASTSAATGSSPARAPERTVGGFEKREIRAGGGQSALSGAKDKGEVKSAALSHVPCRFFKAGACTAGSSCPFSHELGGKKEICQWFLKGDCKFGHKCALAHVRPGEPMSMDRKNKKDQQREARERADAKGEASSLGRSLGDELGTSPATSRAEPSPIPAGRDIAHPVPIKSSISASLHSGSNHSPSRFASSPLREPYGPPAAVVAGSPSAGFNQARPLSGAAGFASSPGRPSPLSASFNARGSATTGVSLKGSSVVSIHSPLRPPGNSAVFSSSFSHASLTPDKGGSQLSASFADSTLRRSIWARSETPDEPLSPARRPIPTPARAIDDVFDEDDGHGEDLIPSSLSDLLTPTERARRMSRNDSHDSAYVGSPGRNSLLNPNQFVGAERLAQSAGAALPPGDFLQALWSQDGQDARRTSVATGTSPKPELTFTSAQPATPVLRQSLLSQQRSPNSSRSSPSNQQVPSSTTAIRGPAAPAVDAPYLLRERVTDPSSPTARALQEHAPGQSLPGGLAAALSRMHMQPGGRAPSGLGGRAPDAAFAGTPNAGTVATPPGLSVPLPARRDEHDDDALFHMDG